MKTLSNRTTAIVWIIAIIGCIGAFFSYTMLLIGWITVAVSAVVLTIFGDE